jgi:N-acetylglucosaminylphosphatidylinositol deacetylase
MCCTLSGNYDGLGTTRAVELQRACAILGVLAERVKVMDDPALQDGMQSHWPSDAVAKHVQHFAEQHSLNTLLTFDDKGVSGHPNHIACCRGVLQFAAATERSPLTVLLLQSTGLLRKYIGAADIVLSWCLCKQHDAMAVCLDPRPVWAAMAAHRTQLVWYRRLFIVFSRYVYVNTFTIFTAAVSKDK